jgi:hypothetical protein
MRHICIVVKKEKSISSFHGKWKHSPLPTKLPSPKDRDLIVFLIKDHNITQSHESQKPTEQIKNMNSLLMSFY